MPQLPVNRGRAPQLLTRGRARQLLTRDKVPKGNLVSSGRLNWRTLAGILFGMLVVTGLSLAVIGCEAIPIEADGIRLGGDYRFPPEQILDNTMAIAVTDDGLDFIEAHGLELLAVLLESEDNTVDLSDFVNDFLTDNPIEIFGWSIRDIDAFATFPDGADSFEFTVLPDPTRLLIRVSRIWLTFAGTVYDDGGFVTSACRLGPGNIGESEPASILLEGLEFEVLLGTTPDGELDIGTNIIDLGLSDTAIQIITDEFDPDYYCNLIECQDGCFECHLFCGGADLILEIGQFFVMLLAPVMDGVLELVANILTGFIRSIEGELHAALLLGDLMPSVHDTEWLGFRFAPGQGGISALPIPGVPTTEANDLLVSLSGGLEADNHPCIPKPDDRPFWVPPLYYDVGAGTPRPHIVFSLADTFIDQAIYTFYSSGALCLEIETSLLNDLLGIEINAGLLSLLLPGLERLTPADAPLLITIQPYFEPDDFPLVRLGEGTPEDSLLSVALDTVDLGIYAQMQGSWVRLVELRTELSLGVTPTVLPDNQLQLAIDSLEARLVDESYNELFVGVELTELINFVLGIAIDFLAEGGLDLTLPLDGLIEELIGIPLNLVIDRLGSAGEDRWLELAVTLEDRGLSGSSLIRTITTEISLLETGPGYLDLEVSAPGVSRESLEFQVRFGAGAWTGFRPATNQRVEASRLLMPGETVVEVRARQIGDYRSLDMSPATLIVDIPDQARSDVADSRVGPSDNTSRSNVAGGCQTVRNRPPVANSLWGFVLAAVLWRRRGAGGLR